jgi:predicted transcriptional regulator
MFDLRGARLAGRLTQEQLAKGAHISRPRISFAESGHLQLRAEEIRRIRKVIAEAPKRYADRVREILTQSLLG